MLLLICWKNRGLRTRHGSKINYKLAKHNSIRLEKVEVSSLEYIKYGVRFSPIDKESVVIVPYSAVNFIEVEQGNEKFSIYDEDLSNDANFLYGIGIKDLKNPEKLLKKYENKNA